MVLYAKIKLHKNKNAPSARMTYSSKNIDFLARKTFLRHSFLGKESKTVIQKEMAKKLVILLK